MPEIVDLRPLKAKAMKLKGPIRDLILGQPDSMTRDDYMAKCGDWLMLLEIRETR